MRYLGRLTRFTTSVFLIGVFLAAGAGRVDAQEAARIALVIGNSAYKIAPPLPNPANDAKLIAETLRGLDFAWTPETLRALFRDGPDAFIPGTKMPMQRIADEAALDDLIDYMRELTATPKAGGAGD